MAGDAPHVPILRFGSEYASLDVAAVAGYADGAPRARVSQANAGLIRRDLLRAGERAAALRAIPTERLLEICAAAAELFLRAELPVSSDEPPHGPDEHVRALSATSGLPHVLCRRNMEKVAHVLLHMEEIVRGLTRGLPAPVLDAGEGDAAGLAVAYSPAADVLGVVLPSNSPGVNGLWIPALALRTPVLLKPGREEPWTPLRVARALVAAGLPAEAIGYYPTDHEGAREILLGADRALLFGDEATTRPYARDPRVEIHGPGRSKVLLGPDEAPRWERHLDVLVESVAANGGRSCVNASAVYVPSHADEIADALAQRLAGVVPRAPEDEAAELSAFANPRLAAAIDAAIEAGLRGGGEDVAARHRARPRARRAFGGDFLLPTVVRCPDVSHPLANVEFLFPFAAVVEMPAEELVRAAGPSLVVTGITRDPALERELLAADGIGRLNLGPVPTTSVRWDQPHEGNLFELLYARRAIERVSAW